MTGAELWGFVHEQGIKPTEAIIALFGVVMLVVGPWLLWQTWRIPRAKLTYRDLTSTFFAFAIAAACLLFSFILVRTRYLLRPGAGRYTVATVFKRDRWKGKLRYACEYYVNGQRWQTGRNCGIAEGRDLPCPALASRFYVYFSPEDPGTGEILSVPVPDSVQHIPANGWARLP